MPLKRLLPIIIANKFSNKSLVDRKIRDRANYNRTFVNISIFRILADSACPSCLKRQHIGETTDTVLKLLTVFLRGAEINANNTRLLSHIRIQNLAERILFELLYHFVDFLDRLLKVSSKLNAHNVITRLI